MEPDPVLSSLAEAAQAIAAQRQRLNKTWENIAAGVAAYAPGASLTDSGDIVGREDDKGRVIAEPDRPTSVAPPAKPPTSQPPEPPRTRRREAEAARQPEVNEGAVDDIMAHFRSNVNRRFTARELASATQYPIDVVRVICSMLMQDGVLNDGFNGTDVTYLFPTPPSSQTKNGGEGQLDSATRGTLITTEDPVSKSTPKPTPKPPQSSGSTSPRPQASAGAGTTATSNLARTPGDRAAMKAPQREAEEKLDYLIQWLIDNVGDKRFCAPDLKDEFTAPFVYSSDWVGNAFRRNLLARGIITDVGLDWSKESKERKARGDGPGRKAVFYKLDPALLGESKTTAPKADALPAPVSEGEGSESSGEALLRGTEPYRKVHEWVKNQKVFIAFSPQVASAGTDVKREFVLEILEDLAKRGEVVDDSPAPDMRLFYRMKPGAQVKAPEPRVSRGSGPVAGTGRQLKISDEFLRTLVQDAIKAGATVEPEPSGGHYNVRFKDDKNRTKKVQIHSTTSGNPRREAANARTRLRREGLKV